MKSFIVSIASLIILVPLLLFLPLGMTFKGKLLLIFFALLMANIGVFSLAVLPFWQVLIVLLLLVVLFTILLKSEKMEQFLFVQDDRKTKKSRGKKDESDYIGEKSEKGISLTKKDEGKEIEAGPTFAVREEKAESIDEQVGMEETAPPLEDISDDLKLDQVEPIAEEKEEAMPLIHPEEKEEEAAKEGPEEEWDEEVSFLLQREEEEVSLQLEEDAGGQMDEKDVHLAEHRENIAELEKLLFDGEETGEEKPLADEPHKEEKGDEVLSAEEKIETLEPISFEEGDGSEGNEPVAGEAPVAEEALLAEEALFAEDGPGDEEKRASEEVSPFAGEHANNVRLGEDFSVIVPLMDEELRLLHHQFEEESDSGSEKEELPAEEKLTGMETISGDEEKELELLFDEPFSEGEKTEEIARDDDMGLSEDTEEEKGKEETITIAQLGEKAYSVYGLEEVEEDMYKPAEELKDKEDGPEAKLDDEFLKEETERSTAVSNEMLSLLFAELREAEKYLPGEEYERLVLSHLVPGLPKQQYYTFATLLIEYYLKINDLEKLEALLLDLHDKYKQFPIILQQIDFALEYYCNKTISLL